MAIVLLPEPPLARFRFMCLSSEFELGRRRRKRRRRTEKRYAAPTGRKVWSAPENGDRKNLLCSYQSS